MRALPPGQPRAEAHRRPSGHAGMSSAVFAPGWVCEQDRGPHAEWPQRSARLWRLIQDSCGPATTSPPPPRPIVHAREAVALFQLAFTGSHRPRSHAQWPASPSQAECRLTHQRHHCIVSFYRTVAATEVCAAGAGGSAHGWRSRPFPSPPPSVVALGEASGRMAGHMVARGSTCRCRSCSRCGCRLATPPGRHHPRGPSTAQSAAPCPCCLTMASSMMEAAACTALGPPSRVARPWPLCSSVTCRSLKAWRCSTRPKPRQALQRHYCCCSLRRMS